MAYDSPCLFFYWIFLYNEWKKICAYGRSIYGKIRRINGITDREFQ